MIAMIGEEFFKLRRRKIVWLMPLILMALMAAISFGEKDRFFFIAAYGAFEYISIMMIALVASTITMEFQHGTIKKMIVDTNGRKIIYFTKYLVMLLYSIFLHIVAVLFTLVVNLMPWTANFSINSVYQHSETMLQALLIGSLLDVFSFFIIVGIVFLVAICSTTSSVAVLVGVALCFMGQGISKLIIVNFGKSIPLIKWNPFNMMNFIDEFNNHQYINVTGLEVSQLFWGNIVYAILFVILGIYFFSKKKI